MDVRRTESKEDEVDPAVSGFEGLGPSVADGLGVEAIAADEFGLALLDKAKHLCIVVESGG